MAQDMTSSSETLQKGGVNLSLMQNGVYVCSLASVPNVIETVGASHLVTLINHNTMTDTPDRIATANHLKLAMNDISIPTPEMVLPNERHVEDLLEFAGRWEQTAPLVVHCWAGISRSTAAAFITLCMLNPDRDERQIAHKLRSVSPTAYPNRKLVELADSALNRQGRMMNAVETIGRGQIALEGKSFGLPARLTEEHLELD